MCVDLETTIRSPKGPRADIFGAQRFFLQGIHGMGKETCYCVQVTCSSLKNLEPGKALQIAPIHEYACLNVKGAVRCGSMYYFQQRHVWRRISFYHNLRRTHRYCVDAWAFTIVHSSMREGKLGFRRLLLQRVRRLVAARCLLQRVR